MPTSIFLKNCFLAILLFTGVHKCLWGQFHVFNFGAHIGGTTSDFYTSKPLPQNAFSLPTLGVLAGIHSSFRFSPGGLLQSEISLSWNSNQGHFFQQKNIDIFNLNIPLLFKGHLFQNLYVGGGLDFNYYLNLDAIYASYSEQPSHLSFLFHVEHVYLHKYALGVRYLQSITPVKLVTITHNNTVKQVASYQPRSLQITFSYYLYRIKYKEYKKRALPLLKFRKPSL